MPNIQFQIRRGTAASWTSTNPRLANGELGFETDTRQLKIGSDLSWNSTGYLNIGQAANWSTFPAYQTVDFSSNVISNSSRIINGPGTVSAPSYTFFNDLSMGLYDPATNVLGFVTSGLERMRIASNGLVGIGTNAPAFPLDISLASGTTVGLTLRQTTNGEVAGIRLSNVATAADIGIAGIAGNWTSSSLSGDLVIRNNSTSNRIHLNANGTGGASALTVFGSNVGINTISPRGALDVSGIAYARLPVTVLTGTTVDLSTNFDLSANSYFYITNSGFSNITTPATAAVTTARGGTFWQFKNSTSSYLSVTLTNTLTLTSPVSIAPSNAITLVVSPISNNTLLLF